MAQYSNSDIPVPKRSENSYEEDDSSHSLGHTTLSCMGCSKCNENYPLMLLFVRTCSETLLK